MARVVALFQRCLRKRPVITNTVVYGTFYTAAEMSQQMFTKAYQPEDQPELDFESAARLAAVGSTIYAPTLYYWYNFLDRKFIGTSVRVVAIKVCADQFIMTPTLLSLFFTLLGVLERREDVFEELREKFIKAFIANQFFWIPAQSVNFYLIPSHLRVVYVATCSFMWINVLCFIKRQKNNEEIAEVIEEVVPEIPAITIAEEEVVPPPPK